MPVALDETLEDILRGSASPEEALQRLQATTADCGAAAVVIKPSLLRWGPSFAISIAQTLAKYAEQQPQSPAVKVSDLWQFVKRCDS